MSLYTDAILTWPGDLSWVDAVNAEIEKIATGRGFYSSYGEQLKANAAGFGLCMIVGEFNDVTPAQLVSAIHSAGQPVGKFEPVAFLFTHVETEDDEWHSHRISWGG